MHIFFKLLVLSSFLFLIPTYSMQLSHWDTPDVLKRKLKDGANPNEFLNGKTILHYAAKEGFLQVAQVLLEHGADHSLESDTTFTPLQYAAKFGHTEIVELLLAYGANPQIKGLYDDEIKARSYSAMDLAIACGKLEAAEAFINSDISFFGKNFNTGTEWLTYLELSKTIDLWKKKPITFLASIDTGMHSFIDNPTGFMPIKLTLSNFSKKLDAKFFLKQLYFAMDEDDYRNSLIGVGVQFIKENKKNAFETLIKKCKFCEDSNKERYEKVAKFRQQLSLYALILHKEQSNNLNFAFK